jgi:hypothetical protein
MHKLPCNSAVINVVKYGIQTSRTLPLNKNRSVYLKIENERKCIEMTSVEAWQRNL